MWVLGLVQDKQGLGVVVLYYYGYYLGYGDKLSKLDRLWVVFFRVLVCYLIQSVK